MIPTVTNRTAVVSGSQSSASFGISFEDEAHLMGILREGLGIGSKSGFCYSDSFTITSWHDGMQRIYVATLGADDKGAISLLAEQACDPADTGVEIQIATKPYDRRDFERTAEQLFQHFVPRPTINIELPPLPDERTVLTHGVITPGAGEWIAVMGCVPYRINLAQLDEQLVSKCLSGLSGTLTFDIGGVAMSASREDLKYTAATKAALVEKFDALVDEFVTHALQQLEAGMFDGWETRLRVQVLARIGLPLPELWLPFLEQSAKVTYSTSDFTIIRDKSACSKLSVTSRTRLLLDDTGNDLIGYRFAPDDYVVRSTSKTPDELRTALDAALAASRLTGVRIELLSTLYWTAPVVPVKKKSNPKHRARMFRLIATSTGHGTKFSDNWEAVVRVPTKDDVFVTVENFRAQGYSDFFKHRAEDVLLTKNFGGTVPEVYGYKSTEMRTCQYEVIGNWVGEAANDLMPSTTYTPDVAVRDEHDESEWGGEVEDGGPSVELAVEDEIDRDPDSERWQTVYSAAVADLSPESREALQKWTAKKISEQAGIVKQHTKMTTGVVRKSKAASFNRMNPARLMEQSIDDLRKYASAHLKIVGASKMPGGKSALVTKILRARKHR